MPRRLPPEPIEPPEERWLLEAQTARNVEALEAEQDGRLDEAITLYERNAAEGFPGDWPYGRLIAIYEKRGTFDQAERVALRAIAALSASTRRTPAARRSTVAVFRRRLTEIRKRARGQAAQP